MGCVLIKYLSRQLDIILGNRWALDFQDIIDDVEVINSASATMSYRDTESEVHGILLRIRLYKSKKYEKAMGPLNEITVRVVTANIEKLMLSICEASCAKAFDEASEINKKIYPE